MHYILWPKDPKRGPRSLMSAFISKEPLSFGKHVKICFIFIEQEGIWMSGEICGEINCSSTTHNFSL